MSVIRSMLGAYTVSPLLVARLCFIRRIYGAMKCTACQKLNLYWSINTLNLYMTITLVSADHATHTTLKIIVRLSSIFDKHPFYQLWYEYKIFSFVIQVTDLLSHEISTHVWRPSRALLPIAASRSSSPIRKLLSISFKEVLVNIQQRE